MDIILTWEKNSPEFPVDILQAGFTIIAETGISIRLFLEKGCNIDPDYVRERISTIFLDGKPVDDISATNVEPGSIIALSGSMPGLMGAMMRSGSPYSSMRGTITHRKGPTDRQKAMGPVQVKLFNRIMKDLGTAFLERGVLVNGNILEGIFSRMDPGDWADCLDVTVNGSPAEQGNLPLLVKEPGNGLIFLRVILENPGASGEKVST